MKKDSKIFIAGHKGTAGSALLNLLKKQGFNNLVYKTRQELDLINQSAVSEFFKQEKPEFVFLAAVLPCGAANVAQRADFIYENLMIQNNIIHSSYKNEVKKLIFYGSGYMYPEKSPNPLKEEYLFQGDLEYGAYSFAIAKIAGAAMCEAYNIQYKTIFLTLVLNNLYGTNANFDLAKSRVLPALLRKIHLAKLLSEDRIEELLEDLNKYAKHTYTSLKEAREYLKSFGISDKSVEIWGTGKVRREFIHSDDLADASLYFMQNINFKDLYKENPINTHINIGTGISYTIKEVAQLVKEIVGFKGELKFNANRPDSSMDRVLDCSKAKNLGWSAKISLEKGIKMMYENYVNGGGGSL